MITFASLPPSEQARQLANPEGDLGLRVAQWMNENNRQSIPQILPLLNVREGNRVLEIGFGSGRAAAQIVAQDKEVHYTGIDISATMVDEAQRYNAELAASGRARFHCASSEQIPFANGSFDRVLAVAVMHFWNDPLASLSEIHRVMQPRAVAVMIRLTLNPGPRLLCRNSASTFAPPVTGAPLAARSAFVP